MNVKYAWLIATAAFLLMSAFCVFLWILSAYLHLPHSVRTLIAVFAPILAIGFSRFVWNKTHR